MGKSRTVAPKTDYTIVGAGIIDFTTGWTILKRWPGASTSISRRNQISATMRADGTAELLIRASITPQDAQVPSERGRIPASPEVRRRKQYPYPLSSGREADRGNIMDGII
ncbi:hypothetical protein ABH19_04255 [Leptospirillum sp. Group II 'CF-1']|jgi:hypothetical protein|nr:hypothetical protein ABH19_04255 [Leptospirillum sp. Group II 'CF-1']